VRTNVTDIKKKHVLFNHKLFWTNLRVGTLKSKLIDHNSQIKDVCPKHEDKKVFGRN
jgi:hypothetical protein